VLDLGFGQRVEIGDDLGLGAWAADRGDPVIQRLLEYEGEEAAEHVTANGLVQLVEDRASGEQVLGGPERLLHGPQMFVAEHGFERAEIGVGAARRFISDDLRQRWEIRIVTTKSLITSHPLDC
jgi:hypothetical protein